MIKLKTLILENDQPILSKMEEQNAFRVMIIKLVPRVVNSYNNFIANKKNKNMKKKFYRIDSKTMADNIKKTNRTKNRVEYDCILKDGHVEFAIVKEIDPIENQEEILIGYLYPTDLGWHHSGGYDWYNFDDLINGPVVYE